MIEFIILEIISIASLLFAILSNLFNFTNLSNYFLLFLWTIVIASIYGLKRKNKLYNVLILFLILPLIFFNTAKAIYFIIISTTFLTVYIIRNVNRGYFNNYIDSFKNSFYFIIGLLIFSYIGDSIEVFFDKTVPFLIIYFVASIILIRNLRHYSIGMNKNLIRKLNRRYLFLITIISVFITIESIRDTIFELLNFLYNLFIDVLFFIIYYPMTFLFNILESIANWILSKTGSNNQIDSLMGEGIDGMENIEVIVRENPLLNGAIKTILTLIIIIILYKILKKYQIKEISNIDYTEQREYISKEEKMSRTHILSKRPVGYSEQIRFYYKKYLLRLSKSNLIIEDYHTSEDINNIAKGIFQESVIERIRNIYIGIRYGNLEGNKTLLEEIKNLYSKLKFKRS